MAGGVWKVRAACLKTSRGLLEDVDCCPAIFILSPTVTVVVASLGADDLCAADFTAFSNQNTQQKMCTGPAKHGICHINTSSLQSSQLGLGASIGVGKGRQATFSQYNRLC